MLRCWSSQPLLPDWLTNCPLSVYSLSLLAPVLCCHIIPPTDEAIASLASSIRSVLGEDTVMVVASDNGGSPWNGGLNQPLRGGTGRCVLSVLSV
jgi:hypothetical protein